MRFVAGQVAVSELHREDAAAPREPVAPSGRCCRQWRSKDAIGKSSLLGKLLRSLPAGLEGNAISLKDLQVSFVPVDILNLYRQVVVCKIFPWHNLK